MRRDEVAALTLPEGKSEHLVPYGMVPGLALRLRAGGSRAWIFSYRIGRRQRRLTLGSATVLSVQEARRQAIQLYAKAKLGIDPAQQKEQAKAEAADTIKSKLPLYLGRQQERVRNGKLRQSSYVEIERHLVVHGKRLHAKSVREPNRRDVASLLSALTEKLSGATINRVQSTWSGFFAWTIGEGLRDDNPVTGTERRDEVKRKRLISVAELRDIWEALRDDAYGDIVRLLILCGSRREEIGGLQHSEIDLKTRRITLPPERTKNGREHEIYLSDSALDILQAQPRLMWSDGTPCDFVFGRGKQGFNDWAGSKIDLDRRIAQARNATGAEPMPDWTLHDFRRLVSTTMNDELGVQPHIVEEVLGHRGEHKRGPAGTYNLATYRKERTDALMRWADYVVNVAQGKEQKVVSLGRVS
jgi:integrase